MLIQVLLSRGMFFLGGYLRLLGNLEYQKLTDAHVRGGGFRKGLEYAHVTNGRPPPLKIQFLIKKNYSLVDKS